MRRRAELRISRRNVLKAGNAAALAALAPWPGFAATATPVTMAIGWIPNVEYAGWWCAIEQGYFAAEGIDAKYIPGGPNAPDTLVTLAAEKSQLSDANWLPILDAVAKGNQFVILGATWAKSPAAIMSMAKAPIRKPADIVGKTILTQNPTDRQIIDAILSNAGLPLDSYKVKPTGFSPEPLLSGDGEGYLAFATNQPITFENMGMTEGKDFYVTLMDDLGYHVKQGLLVTKKSYATANRPLLVGYLKALVKGWNYACANPDYAAKVVVEKYGADLGLDAKQQLRQMQLQIPLVKPAADTKLFDIDLSVITGGMTQAAKAAGRTVPPVEQIVDLGPLHEAQAAL